MSSELTSDKPVAWLLMMLLDQGCVITMCFGGCESVRGAKEKTGIFSYSLDSLRGRMASAQRIPGVEGMRIYVLVFFQSK